MFGFFFSRCNTSLFFVWVIRDMCRGMCLVEVWSISPLCGRVSPNICLKIDPDGIAWTNDSDVNCSNNPTPPLCLQVAKIAAYAYSAISQIKVDAKEELVVQFAIPWFDSSATNVTPPILLPSLCHCCLLTLLHPGPFSYASKDRQHCKMMAQYDRPLLLFNMGNGRRCNVDGAMFSAHICTHKAANCLSCVDLRKSQNRLWMGKKNKNPC